MSVEVLTTKAQARQALRGRQVFTSVAGTDGLCIRISHTDVLWLIDSGHAIEMWESAHGWIVAPVDPDDARQEANAAALDEAHLDDPTAQWDPHKSTFAVAIGQWLEDRDGGEHRQQDEGAG